MVARGDLLAAGRAVFDRDGFEGATVAAIRTWARASNGSFFHFFGSKKELAGALFLEVLQRYHAAVLAAIDASSGAAEGIGRLIRAHLDWVVNNRREARYLFEISRSEWTEDVRDAQRAQNSRLAEGIEAWRTPLIARGELLPMTPALFFSHGRQGFMAHIGAELSELTRGACTLAVDRRPELLQQHGLFHGGVTAFLVDNATTIAAATSRGQAALTAEYKLNLLSPASGERLICRARVIKPGRQVAVVAADVFCVIDGIEKHTATALASIAMLAGEVPAEMPSPA